MRRSVGKPPQMKFAFKQYSEVTDPDLNVELQAHTTWTDGKASVGDMLAQAQKVGLDSIALTEHVRRGADWFEQFAIEVRAQSENYPELNVLVGCEAKALDTEGSLDVDDAVRERCDLVLGVVHRMTLPSGQGFYDPKSFSAQEFQELELRHTLGLIRTAPIDVVGHPMGMSLRHFGDFPENCYRRLMEAAKERSVAVEINSSYLGDRLPAFLALCREINPLVSIGSDAHEVETVGRCRDRLRGLR